MIHYRNGYNNRLFARYSIYTGIVGEDCGNAFVSLTPSGRLIIEPGYSWDGITGPVPTTRRNIRASLVHDALCQLLREGMLPAHYRTEVDALFREICIEDGVWRPFAWVYWACVRQFGEKVIFDRRVKVLEAP